MSQVTKLAAVLITFSINAAVLIGFGLSVSELTRYTAVLAGATLIPGLLLLHWLLPRRSGWYRLVLAANLGICLNILLYALLGELNSWHYLVPVLAAVFLIYLLTGGLTRDLIWLQQICRGTPARLWAGASAVSWLLLGLTVIFMYIPTPLPGNQAVVYHVDIPWHLGNAAQILHHWLPEDPRLAGNPFNYHIFFYVWMAFLSRISGIGLPVVYLRLAMLTLIYLLACNAYFAGSRWHSSRSAGVWHVSLLFIFGTALISWPFNLLLRNLYTSPTFLLAVTLLAALLTELKAWWQRSDPKRLLVILLLAFGLSGAKGSFMPIVLAALIPTAALGLLKGRGKADLWLLASASAVFMLVFFWIFKGTGSEGLNVLPGQIILNTARYQQYVNWLPGVEPSWHLLLFIPIYALLFLSFRLIGLLGEMISVWRHRNALILDKSFLIFLFLFSLVPAFMLSYRGSSEYYYLLVGYCGLNLLAAGYLVKINCRPGLVKLLIVFLLLTSLADTAATINYQHYINQKFAGIRNEPVTPAVYDALEFIRLKTDPDDIVACYRSFWLNEEDPRFFYYSAFTQRRMVVEGWMYMSAERQLEAQNRYVDMQKLFVTRSSSAARQVIKKYDIDYILVDRSHRQRLRFPRSGIVEKVYGNDEMEVFRTL